MKLPTSSVGFLFYRIFIIDGQTGSDIKRKNKKDQ
jgi:hypothetical protein